MAETHINAFFGAVAEAEAKVAVVQGELDAAKAALEVKKREVGYEEPKEPEAAKEAAGEPEASEVVKVDVKKNKK